MQKRGQKSDENPTTVLKRANVTARQRANKRGPSVPVRSHRRGTSGGRLAAKAVVNVAALRQKTRGPVAPGNRRRTTTGNPVGPRIAQNLVKRAMLGNRRQAIATRIGSTSNTDLSETHRLAQEVRKWRNTAQLLHSALKAETSKNNPRNRRIRIPNNFQGGMSNNSQIQVPNISKGRISNNMQGRLGWVGKTKLGSQRKNYNVRNMRKTNVNMGSMRSDEISRAEENIKRITADVYTRYESQQFPARRNTRFNNLSSYGNQLGFPARSKQYTGNNNRGFGRQGGRFLQRDNFFNQEFDTRRLQNFNNNRSGPKGYRGKGKVGRNFRSQSYFQ